MLLENRIQLYLLRHCHLMRTYLKSKFRNTPIIFPGLSESFVSSAAPKAELWKLFASYWVLLVIVWVDKTVIQDICVAGEEYKFGKPYCLLKTHE